MKARCTINMVAGVALMVLLQLLCNTATHGQGAMRLVAEAVYANDSVNYTLSDSTSYIYSSGRTSNMKTGQHMFDTASHWVTLSRAPYVRNMQLYDAVNRVTGATTQLYKGAGWRNSQQFLYKYLSGNQYDTVWLNSWDTANAVWNTRRIYKYKYAAGHIDSIYWLKPAGSSWTIEAVDAYVYTDTLLTKHTLDVWNDTLSQWDRWQLETYHYDAIGKADTYERYTIDIPTRLLKPERKEVYVYDAAQRIAGKWTYYWFTVSQSWQGINEFYYSYNSHGDIDVEVKNYWDLFAGMWGPLSKTYYYYDLSFNITDIIEKQFDYPIFKNYATTSWLYNSSGLPTIKRDYVWSDLWNTWLPEKSNNSQILYYYEKYNNIAASPATILADVYPNPATGSVNLRLHNRPEKPVAIHLHDMQGRLVRMWQENAGDSYTLQLQGLQSGQYLLRVATGSEEMTKLLIIANQ